jgi:hypothetical protein
VVRPLWQCVQPVAPDLRFATMVNGRYVFVSDPEALLCKGQVRRRHPPPPHHHHHHQQQQQQRKFSAATMSLAKLSRL